MFLTQQCLLVCAQVVTNDFQHLNTTAKQENQTATERTFRCEEQEKCRAG